VSDTVPVSTHVYDLYGTKTLSMGDLRDAIQSNTGLWLDLRNSQHLGGDYFRGGDIGGEEFTIQQNWDEEGETIEEEFREYPVLFRVDRSRRADELREALKGVAGLQFLKRS